MNQRSFRRRSRAGFTLIELLLVLVILGVLAALVVPKFVGRGEDARKAAATTDIARVAGQLQVFEQDSGRFPTNDEGLRALVEAPANVKKWNGPYLSKLPSDPWGQPYQYRFPGTLNPKEFDLFSFGGDGREGGDDDIIYGATTEGTK